jgi:L-alanine-DL-glutamate epimerase-like enolase superfamily enzyme
MWDGSCAYSLEDATAVGRELAQQDALCFEAPMQDESGPALRILASRVQVPLVPDGLVDRSPGDLVTDTRDGIWGAIRLDVTRSSSLARSLQLVRLAEILGLPAEVQSYGFPLARHANLQLMLTSSACRFYESPFPDTLNDPLTEPPILDSGYVYATDEPGLGHGTTAAAVRGACVLIAAATARAPQATRLPQRAR